MVVPTVLPDEELEEEEREEEVEPEEGGRRRANWLRRLDALGAVRNRLIGL
jgi:hypothetical protein